MTEGQVAAAAFGTFAYAAGGFVAACNAGDSGSAFVKRNAIAIGALWPVAILSLVGLAALDTGTLFHERRVARIAQQRKEMAAADEELRAAGGWS